LSSFAIGGGSAAVALAVALALLSVIPLGNLLLLLLLPLPLLLPLYFQLSFRAQRANLLSPVLALLTSRSKLPPPKPVKPPNTSEVTKPPINTSDLYFQNLA
jgi:hypothetical protein